MKKIVLAFDGPNFSDGAFEFARQLNEVSPLLLTGIFLPHNQLIPAWNTVVPVAAGYINGNDADVAINISRFEKQCQRNGIDYRIHRDSPDGLIAALAEESEFADLVILGSQSFYKGFGRQEQSLYLHATLHELRCPVMVVPEKYRFPEKNVLAYDGSSSAVFAIKQYAYLFPEFCAMNSTLVKLSKTETEEFPYLQQMEELAARHFPDLDILNLALHSPSLFNSWLSEHQPSVLICGSFGRSGISQLLKKSFIAGIIDEGLMPVFIAHH
jgi:nucleotide-binding universal stress UspA family protein